MHFAPTYIWNDKLQQICWNTYKKTFSKESVNQTAYKTKYRKQTAYKKEDIF